MDTVSVIVPNYNETDNLRLCLDSLLNQQYANIEIILVDDGSDKASRAICRNYSQLYSSILLIESSNYGVSHARNIGIDVASGKYITFVDSDDVIERDYISILVNTLNNTKADIAASRLSLKSASSKRATQTSVVSAEFAAELFAHEYGWFCCGKLYKRSLFTSASVRFNEGVSVCEDLLLNLDILKTCNNVVFIGEAGYIYRQRRDSATNNLNNARWFDIFDAYKLALMVTSNNEKLLFALSFNCELMLCEAEYRLKYLDDKDKVLAEKKMREVREKLPLQPHCTFIQRVKLALSRQFPELIVKIRRRGINDE